MLFVGNHTLMGLYDLPILMLELYLRGFKVPLTVDQACVQLMRQYMLGGWLPNIRFHSMRALALSSPVGGWLQGVGLHPCPTRVSSVHFCSQPTFCIHLPLNTH